MLPLDVPFLPDDSYVRFLEKLGSQIHAVHFGLYDPSLCDARVRLRRLSLQDLAVHLDRLPGPKKYLLANGRFQPADLYRGEKPMRRIIEGLEQLSGAGLLDGIIFADSYLLTALADAATELAGRLEAVPSINFGIDSVGKLESLLEMISASGFRAPGKIPLDRSLNRRPGKLAVISQEIRRRWPAMKIELLANEGCLPHCPYRSTHEALIAAANLGMGIDTHRLNRDLACIRVLEREPHRIFASPFIRPEDAGRYGQSADIIKVCGRTLGPGFLARSVGAYAAGVFRGNLLDLLDAAHWMAGRWEIDNGVLPDDFASVLSAVQPLDAACRALWQRHARLKPWRFATLGDVPGVCIEEP